MIGLTCSNGLFSDKIERIGIILQVITFRIVIIKKVRSAEPKKLDEARGQITSDYQTYLEKEWIEALKDKYPVEVDRSLLSRIEN